jgi:hypothetical protein
MYKSAMTVSVETLVSTILEVVPNISQSQWNQTDNSSICERSKYEDITQRAAIIKRLEEVIHGENKD